MSGTPVFRPIGGMLFSLLVADEAWQALMKDVRAADAQPSPLSSALIMSQFSAFISLLIRCPKLQAKIGDEFHRRLQHEGPSFQGSLP